MHDPNEPPRGAADRLAYLMWAAWVNDPAATYPTWLMLPDAPRADWLGTAQRLSGHAALRLGLSGVAGEAMSAKALDEALGRLAPAPFSPCHGAGIGMPPCAPTPEPGTCRHDGCALGR